MYNVAARKGYAFPTTFFWYGRSRLSALFVLLLFGILIPYTTNAQADTTATSDSLSSNDKKVRLFVLPLAFYTPETRLGFGAAGAMAFNWRKSLPTDRPSQLQLGFAYTLNKQILLYLPYQIFTRNEQWSFSGELGFYRYFFYFYGIGNDAWLQEREVYEVSFPRLRFRGVYRFQEKNFFGLSYWMDAFYNLQPEEYGIIDQGNITGKEGGVVSGVGPLFIHDSRNNVFAPWKGYYLEAGALWNSPTLGSDFKFQKYILDARTYLIGRPDRVLALQLYGEFTGGAPPFYQLAQLGGTRRMRGVVEGRLRDNHYVMMQAEWRQDLFWRIGYTVFAGFGGVAPDISSFELTQFRLVGGVGLRFLLIEEDRINVRIDYGFGRNTSGLYITVSEAF